MSIMKIETNVTLHKECHNMTGQMKEEERVKR
jgi:hypothetical protein